MQVDSYDNGIYLPLAVDHIVQNIGNARFVWKNPSFTLQDCIKKCLLNLSNMNRCSLIKHDVETLVMQSKHIK